MRHRGDPLVNFFFLQNNPYIQYNNFQIKLGNRGGQGKHLDTNKSNLEVWARTGGCKKFKQVNKQEYEDSPKFRGTQYLAQSYWGRKTTI